MNRLSAGEQPAALRRSRTTGSSAARSAGRQRMSPHSLASLYRDEKYSDLLIKCQAREFKVHKAIVCPQCPFFDRACSSGFQESFDGVIDLREVDPDILDRVICFLYTGTYLDGDPETEIIPAPEEIQARRPKSSNSTRPGEEAVNFAYALSSQPSPRDNPSVHSHQNLLALQSVPAWDDARFRSPFLGSESGEPEPSYIDNAFHYGDSTEPSTPDIPLSQSTGASGTLYIHLHVYILADMYDIAALRTYAAGQFMRTAETRWRQMRRFPEIVDELYDSTPRNDPLRELVTELVAKHYQDVMFRSWMRPVMEKHNDLTLGVLDKIVSSRDVA